MTEEISIIISYTIYSHFVDAYRVTELGVVVLFDVLITSADLFRI